jgi:hypothetical protein
MQIGRCGGTVYALVSKTSPARVEGSNLSTGTSKVLQGALSKARSGLGRLSFTYNNRPYDNFYDSLFFQSLEVFFLLLWLTLLSFLDIYRAIQLLHRILMHAWHNVRVDIQSHRYLTMPKDFLNNLWVDFKTE